MDHSRHPRRTPSGTTRAVVVVAVAVAALGLAGCHGRSGVQRATSGDLDPVTVSLTVSRGQQPQGRFLTVMSPGGTNDDQLYELRFAPPEVKRLSPTKRVSAVGACESRVVVTTATDDAQDELGFDRLQELEGQEFGPLEGLGPVAALGPSVGPDCRVAYTFVDRTGPVTFSELRTWDPTRKQGRTLYRTRPGDGLLGRASWGPKGEVAVLRLSPEAPEPPGSGQAERGRPAAVVVVRPNGSSFELDPGTLDPVGLVWGKTMMAVGDGEARTILLDPTGERNVVDLWRPLSWSPKGDALLVKDAATGRILGLADPGTGSVREVGRLTGSVFDVDWLPD